MMSINSVMKYAPFLFVVSDYYVYKTCSLNVWSILNCYFLFTFPVIIATFLLYIRSRREKYISLALFFANLCNMSWTMIGILLTNHYTIEQYLWLRFIVHASCTIYFYTLCYLPFRQ